jgi:hypothetical protein
MTYWRPCHSSSCQSLASRLGGPIGGWVCGGQSGTGLARSTSVSPANHSNNFSIIITRGWHNRPVGDRIAEWTQSNSTLPSIRIKDLLHIKWGFFLSIQFVRVQILRCWTLSSFRLYLKHRSVYFSKHAVSENGFCLRLQVKPTQMGPIDRASPYLRTWAQLRFYLRMEAESSLWNVVLKNTQNGVFRQRQDAGKCPPPYLY